MAQFNFGQYPAEYDAKIHGPYDPARYYGKRKYFDGHFEFRLHNL